MYLCFLSSEKALVAVSKCLKYIVKGENDFLLPTLTISPLQFSTYNYSYDKVELSSYIYHNI